MDDLDIGTSRSVPRRLHVQKKAKMIREAPAVKKTIKPKAKKKRKRTSGSAKGFSFERKLAVIFGEWWTKGARDDIFWRTEGSGSRATSRAKRGKRTRFQYGDMTFTDPIGKPLIEAFSFEFKNYRTYDLLSVFAQTDPNKSWLVFWAEARIDAELSHREPILITKKNQHKIIMWLTHSMYYALHSSGYHPYPRMFIQLAAQTVRLKKGKKIDIPEHCVVGVLFDDFIENVDPTMFEELLYVTNRATRAGDFGNAAAAAEAAAGIDGKTASSPTGGSSSAS